MTDPRLQPSELRGEGDRFCVTAPVACLLDDRGNRQRELVFGQGFRVLRDSNDLVWGYSVNDGYLGWIQRSALGPDHIPTHRICVQRTIAKNRPDLKMSGTEVPFSFGARLKMIDASDEYVKFVHPDGGKWIPACHVAPIDQYMGDIAGVAEIFLGTPYLWGGNSAFGIDCSGLVQAAAYACGLECPGDSDLQANAFGGDPIDGPTSRNDLYFWKGHVAIALDDRYLIHANAHAMAVSVESISGAIERILKAGEGPVTARGKIV